MSYIDVTPNGHILEIKLNRPDKYNALTVDMYHDIAKAYGELDCNPELRVGVFYGEGKHFTSGLELTDWIPLFSSNKRPDLPEGSIDPFRLDGSSLSKPIVMAVQGYCYTAGVEMMLNTDIRVAARNTVFCQMEVQRGLYACGGATLRLQKEIGWANAQRYLMTGDTWNAEEAYRMGMIQELCDEGEQFVVAMSLARKIANAAPLGVQGSLKSSKLARDEGERAALEKLFLELKPVMNSQDIQEGIQSFLQRRDAKFTGK